MANTPSAKKRVRTNDARREVNRNRIGRIRTYVKKAEAAIEAGDRKAAEDAFKSAMPEMHRGATKGVLHKNTVARKISRMSKAIAGL